MRINGSNTKSICFDKAEVKGFTKVALKDRFYNFKMPKSDGVSWCEQSNFLTTEGSNASLAFAVDDEFSNSQTLIILASVGLASSTIITDYRQINTPGSDIRISLKYTNSKADQDIPLILGTDIAYWNYHLDKLQINEGRGFRVWTGMDKPQEQGAQVSAFVIKPFDYIPQDSVLQEVTIKKTNSPDITLDIYNILLSTLTQEQIEDRFNPQSHLQKNKFECIDLKQNVRESLDKKSFDDEVDIERDYWGRIWRTQYSPDCFDFNSNILAEPEVPPFKFDQLYFTQPKTPPISGYSNRQEDQDAVIEIETTVKAKNEDGDNLQTIYFAINARNLCNPDFISKSDESDENNIGKIAIQIPGKREPIEKPLTLDNLQQGRTGIKVCENKAGLPNAIEIPPLLLAAQANDATDNKTVSLWINIIPVDVSSINNSQSDEDQILLTITITDYSEPEPAQGRNAEVPFNDPYLVLYGITLEYGD